LTFRVDQVVTRKLIRFGYPFIYAGLAFWLFGSMDRWLLAYMSTVEEVGIYSIAYRFASVILFVSMAFGQAWSPLAIKIQADHPQIYRAIYVDILLALLCGMLLIGSGVALFSQEILIWLMPAEYYGAALLLSVLTLGLILQSTLQVTAIGISLEKKTYLFGRLSWMAVALNLILNLLMIPAAGGLGAAIATALSYLFLTGAYLFYTQRLHPLPLPWGKLLVLAVLWMTVAGCLIGRWSGHNAASSVAWRLSVMFVVLLVCAKLIPMRWGAHVER
jgi:O-antigen/teichoic acid export membrane protein